MESAFYLASRSPRRRELLDLVGLAYRALDVSVDETPNPGVSPEDYVRSTALSKAQSGCQARHDGLPVLGADTAVILGGEIMGKPRDGAHALQMLERLSGRWHEVLTGFAVVQGEREHVDFTRTRVLMARLLPREIEAYWRSGEPADKAGGYAIQGRGGAFVREIRGSYTGVVGLPLFETMQALARFGVSGLGLGSEAQPA
jgi:septum formation protein